MLRKQKLQIQKVLNWKSNRSWS